MKGGKWREKRKGREGRRILFVQDSESFYGAHRNKSNNLAHHYLTCIENSMKLSMNIAIMRCVIDYKYVGLGCFQLEQAIIISFDFRRYQLCLKSACLCSHQGMIYLHKSVFQSHGYLSSAQSHGYLSSAQSHGYLSSAQSHGYLSSANCHVDGRWVLKITGFGLQAFRNGNCGHEVSEHQ